MKLNLIFLTSIKMVADLEIVFVFKNEKDKALMERFLALDAFEHPKKYEEDEMLYRLDEGFHFRRNMRNEKPYINYVSDYPSDVDREREFGSYFITCSIDKDILGHERRFAKDIAYLYNTFFARYVKLYLIDGKLRIYEYTYESDVSDFSFNDVCKFFDMLESI